MSSTFDAHLSERGREALRLAEQIGREVAGPCSAAVDAEARFPVESVAAIRLAGLLGASVPAEFGGWGLSLTDIAAVSEQLGMFCASAAMVFAMHHIQVACLARHHGESAHLADTLRRIAAEGSLVGSATTERTTGGDIRSSTCAVEPDGPSRFRLVKDASVLSYGDFVDDVLVTARATPASPPSDQVIVHVSRPELTLTRTGEWNALGMRGTESVGFLIEATGSTERIVSTPYADVSARTMVPWAHATWAALWTGIAGDAVQRTRAFARHAARSKPGTVPAAATHLVDVYADYLALRAMVATSVADYERHKDDIATIGSAGFALRMAALKLYASRAAGRIVQDCMHICGLSGYRLDGEYSLGRHLRDLHSATIMIHNDRIVDGSAKLLCVYKES